MHSYTSGLYLTFQLGRDAITVHRQLTQQGPSMSIVSLQTNNIVIKSMSKPISSMYKHGQSNISHKCILYYPFYRGKRISQFMNNNNNVKMYDIHSPYQPLTHLPQTLSPLITSALADHRQTRTERRTSHAVTDRISSPGHDQTRVIERFYKHVVGTLTQCLARVAASKQPGCIWCYALPCNHQSLARCPVGREEKCRVHDESSV